MSATVRLHVDGRLVQVPAGASVAAAVAQATLQFRQSSSGQARAPLCGMGVCFECRVRIDGVGQQRACLVDACDGMQVRTDG
ncbi:MULTISPECIES: 2Fe-2S iron-sulfur cluster-binding protein [Xanthomonas]|uniref:(2Fe-2S)-binding protein n=1 Tax=Xanthomonas phaseoli pv. dieffenbachiae TaxID=92828 RepID=A0A1V9HCF9_9XANT|nr:2Fe-2S iron-sulfur cluster-binding protein [Xanthomonas phaseoli]MBO9769836.1 (2Fe-2S)-binding protein [Xanthomonas phaseoli pv. dieffenbachiae]MBO9776822.1 (2Fe-2S)-binding protein [Xanthomonas phaseoli pv. dieffenbachiae]MBO9778713.1 (2Fe-2S)-binding protein [Xanthomonas phaseoli pv. dieffenbachiae]MBO9789057.1 (2Fe-2S)-binding protein [Xanthomonas phaseoli pv. dieffenbachiae]MBO9796601.1 (2Fe-2S)-binding protein [Xanthomonas phaseoli pv. dieffenbachiae]